MLGKQFDDPPQFVDTFPGWLLRRSEQNVFLRGRSILTNCVGSGEGTKNGEQHNQTEHVEQRKEFFVFGCIEERRQVASLLDQECKEHKPS